MKWLPRRVPRALVLQAPGVAALLLLVGGCHQSGAPLPQNRVVLYCSVDEVYAKPLIARLQTRTGLRIDTAYDTEATKTAGLAYRIRAERSRPQGDVFWSSALLQTLLLGREGLLQPYPAAAAADIPAAFKEASGLWTGLALRARIAVFHRSTRRGSGPDGFIDPKQPWSLPDLLAPRLKGKIGISNPQFGSASDWAAALATRWGVRRSLDFFRALKSDGVRVLPGNSVVAEKVALGELLAGITDPDDYMTQARRHGSLFAIAPDAGSANSGAVLVPGSVALLHGAPHPEAARRLIDALLARHTEQMLIARMEGILPLHAPPAGSSARSRGTYDLLSRRAPADTAQWPAAWDAIRDPLAEILLKD